MKMFMGSFITWKTLGADTRQARAEERVAPKMPALIRGANADTKLIVWSDTEKNVISANPPDTFLKIPRSLFDELWYIMLIYNVLY